MNISDSEIVGEKSLKRFSQVISEEGTVYTVLEWDKNSVTVIKNHEPDKVKTFSKEELLIVEHDWISQGRIYSYYFRIRK